MALGIRPPMAMCLPLDQPELSSGYWDIYGGKISCFKK